MVFEVARMANTASTEKRNTKPIGVRADGGAHSATLPETVGLPTTSATYDHTRIPNGLTRVAMALTTPTVATRRAVARPAP